VSLFGAALLLVLIPQVWWILPVLRGESALFARDVIGFRLPYHVEFAEQVAQGRWPAWTPDINGGMPLWHHPAAELADPSALLFVLLPPQAAYGAQVLFHMVLATVGVALLCRSLRVHPVLCAWAGLLFVATGPVASLWTVKFIPTSSLPWLVLAARHCARPNARSAEVGLAVATAYACLHPDPPALLGAAALSVVVALGCAPASQRKSTLLRLTAGAGLGALLAAPFLVPAAWVALSADRADVVRGATSAFSAYALLESLAPGSMGLAAASGAGAGMSLLRSGETHLVAHFFVGVSSLALMATRARRRVRLHALLAVLCVVLGVLALGEQVPGTSWFWARASSRFPDKLLIPAALAWLLLAARRGSVMTKMSWMHVPLATAGLLALLGADSLAGVVTHPLTELSGALQTAAQEQMSAALVRSGAVLVVAALACVMAARTPQHRTGWLAVVAVVTAVEAVGCLASLNLGMDVERWRNAVKTHGLTPWAGQAIYAGRVGLTGPAVSPVVDSSVPDDESAVLQLALADPSSGVLDGARYPVGADFSRLEPARMHAFMEHAVVNLPMPLLVRVLQRLGVERALLRDNVKAPPTDTVKLLGIQTFSSTDTWWDLQMLEPLPRISVETTWQVEDDLKTATLALATPGGPRVVVGSTAGPPAQEQQTPTLLVEEQHADVLRVRVESSAPALLVVRESFDPGWQATVDGALAPVHVVNTCQRGVLVPGGAHTVELHYRTRGALPGVLVGAAALGVLLLLARRRPEKGPGGSA